MAIHFNGTFEEYVNIAINSKGTNMRKLNRECSSRGSDSSWAGASWPDAVEFSLHGDDRAAERIKKTALDVADIVVKSVPSYNIEYTNDEGAFVDVSRFVVGEPECMAKFVEGEKTYSRSISIAINMCFSSSCGAADILALGGKVAGVILGLQSSGINARVFLYYDVVTNGGKNQSQCIIDCSHIDITKIAAAFSPYFLRRINFAWSEDQSEDYIKRFEIGQGYGQAGHNPCEVKTDMCINNPMDLLRRPDREFIDMIMNKLQELKK